MITQNYFTLPFYLPRICRLWSNWPEYLLNYVLRRRRPTVYRIRKGLMVLDTTGTLPGTIVDVGANVGSFAVYAAQASPDARIFCYEPEPQNFLRLRQNLRINGLDERVAAFQCAVSSSGAPRSLGVGVSQLNSFENLRGGANYQVVACTTLRDIRAEHRLDRLDLLKMNCEGAEYEILDACSNGDLEGILNIRLEYHNLDGKGRNGASLRRWLQARGYRIERFTRRLTDSGYICARAANAGGR
jgi:FkbM family methyltransferase